MQICDNMINSNICLILKNEIPDDVNDEATERNHLECHYLESRTYDHTYAITNNIITTDNLNRRHLFRFRINLETTLFSAVLESLIYYSKIWSLSKQK